MNPSQSHRTDNSKTLISLPAELRYMIMEYVLEDFVRNSGDGKFITRWHIPGALQACQTLRQDGVSLLLKMHLAFEIRMLDPTEYFKMVRWARILVKIYRLEDVRLPEDHVNLMGSFKGQVDRKHVATCRKNLFRWLKAFYAGDFPGLLLEERFPERHSHVRIPRDTSAGERSVTVSVECQLITNFGVRALAKVFECALELRRANVPWERTTNVLDCVIRCTKVLEHF